MFLQNLITNGGVPPCLEACKTRVAGDNQEAGISPCWLFRVSKVAPGHPGVLVSTQRVSGRVVRKGYSGVPGLVQVALVQRASVKTPRLLWCRPVGRAPADYG